MLTISLWTATAFLGSGVGDNWFGAGIASLLFIGLAVSARGEAFASDKLKPCPDTPNCVSTVDTDNQHGMEPIPYTGAQADARVKMLAVLEEMPRTTIVAQEDNYLHVEFRSLIFRFVDDVEFVFDDDAKLIHFRSAARLGHSDLGVNRRRMGRIQQAFAAM